MISGLGPHAQRNYLGYLETASPEEIRQASSPLLSADDVWVVLVGTHTPELQRELEGLAGVVDVRVRSYDEVLEGPLLP